MKLICACGKCHINSPHIKKEGPRSKLASSDASEQPNDIDVVTPPSGDKKTNRWKDETWNPLGDLND